RRRWPSGPVSRLAGAAPQKFWRLYRAASQFNSDLDLLALVALRCVLRRRACILSTTAASLAAFSTNLCHMRAVPAHGFASFAAQFLVPSAPQLLLSGLSSFATYLRHVLAVPADNFTAFFPGFLNGHISLSGGFLHVCSFPKRDDHPPRAPAGGPTFEPCKPRAQTGSLG